MNEVDIYPVGVLHEFLLAYRLIRNGFPREAWGRLKRIPGMWSRRNSWNGYLAEPKDSSVPFTRAGHGWTRRRALADLQRHMANIGGTCRGCGALMGSGVPAAEHCGKCPPWRCETCRGMNSMANPCQCWASLEGMSLADVKALLARDGGLELHHDIASTPENGDTQ